MIASSSKPLLTFALVSCNQEPFVREAVQAAFAQDYSPLQIILSDDCSDDRSFEVMRELAQAYRGPHEVVLNRNSSRRIMGGHLNRVLELAKGELIIIAAADDVSLPHRTRVICDAWERSGRQATSLFSGVITINTEGQPIKPIAAFDGEFPERNQPSAELAIQALAYVQTLKPTVHGCSHAICPKLYRRLGNLPENVVYEDKVLAFRSVLAGKTVYIPEPLVKYRIHGANLFKYLSGDKLQPNLQSLARHEAELRTGFRNSEIMFAAFLQDLETACRQGLMDPHHVKDVQREAEHRQLRCSVMNRFLAGGWITKCRLLLSARRLGLNAADIRLLQSRLLPEWLYLRIRLARSRMSRGAGPASTATRSSTVPDTPDVA